MSVPEEITSKTPAWSGEDLNSDPHESKNKAERVQKMFTAIALKYDLNNRLHSMWRDQVWRKNAVRMAELRGGEDVLDVACGTGDLAMAFYKSGIRSILGIDFTEAMLDIARSKARRAGMSIEYRQGDAMQLDLPDSSQDVVSIAFGIRNVQDTTKAFSEFYRVLRKRGRLIVLEFSTPRNRIIRAINNMYTKRVMPITATFIARDTSGAYKYLPKSVETFTEPKELMGSIESAGFESVACSQQTFGVCTLIRGMKR